MAEEREIDLYDIGPADVQVIIETGPEFKPSPRLKDALEELASALAHEEVAEVSGYSLQPTMNVGKLETGDFNSAVTIGCLRVGCVRVVGCTGKIVIKN